MYAIEHSRRLPKYEKNDRYDGKEQEGGELAALDDLESYITTRATQDLPFAGGRHSRVFASEDRRILAQ